MKYLKRDLYERAACNDGIEWEDAYDQYIKEFASISNCFPPEFISYYEKRYLHDAQLVSLSMCEEQDEKQDTAPCLLTEWVALNGKEHFYIKYCGIEEFHCTNMHVYLPFPRHYIYGELLKTSTHFTHEFVIDFGVMYQITFHKLKFKMKATRNFSYIRKMQ